jgi:D-lactate dehydrogenase (cytochrome)
MTKAFQPVTDDLLAALTAIVGDGNLSTRMADREQHARDQGAHPGALADLIIWPSDTSQVAAILRIANAANVPVTAWGAGTSIEANPIALHGGILLSLARMNQILAVHADDFQVTVQPGIGYKNLNAALARHGLFFPPDPGANASIGGMLANNAAGIRTVRYGATRDNVLSLEVVLADGRIMRLGSRSVKQSAGYDLVHLIVGSEGTLAIITEATLKLWPIAPAIGAAVAAFPSVEAAVEAVVTIRGSGMDPAALELIDQASTALLTRHNRLDLIAAPTLFMEFHAANQQALAENLSAVEAICQDLGVQSFRSTTNETERRSLWYARHHAYETMVRTHPGERIFINDVAVPISAYPTLIAYIEQERAARGIAAYLLGHAGDGNIHVLFPFGDPETYQQCQALNAAIVERALALGGTATGEHGVGQSKARFMPQEHGPALDLMRAIKQTLDPHGILNPGKIFP